MFYQQDKSNAKNMSYPFQTIIAKFDLLTIFFGVIVLFAIALVLLPTSYSTNDDILMEGIASGLVGGRPDNHLVFINIILGEVLRSLNTFSSSIPWYTGMLITLQALSVTLVIGGFRNCKIDINKSGWVAILILFVFHFYILFDLQFTTTAHLLSSASLFFILTTLSLDKFRRGNLFFGVVSFLFAMMLRKESAILALLVIVVPIVYILLFTRYKNLGAYIFTFFCLISLSFALIFTDSNAYENSREWKYYKSINKSRGLLMDGVFFNPKTFEHDLKAKKWSLEEFRTFKGFNPDRKGYSDIKDLEYFSKQYMVYAFEKVNEYGLIQIFVQLLGSLKYFTGLVIIFYIYSFAQSNKLGRYFIVLTSTIIALVVLFIAQVIGVKERILFPLLHQFILAIVVSQSIYGTTLKNRLGRNSGYLYFIFISITIALEMRGIVLNAFAERKATVSGLKGWKSVRISAGAIIITHDLFPRLIDDPLHEFNHLRTKQKIKLIPTTWLHHSPWQTDAILDAGLDTIQSMYVQILNRPNAFVFTNYIKGKQIGAYLAIKLKRKVYIESRNLKFAPDTAYLHSYRTTKYVQYLQP